MTAEAVLTVPLGRFDEDQWLFPNVKVATRPRRTCACGCRKRLQQADRGPARRYFANHRTNAYERRKRRPARKPGGSVVALRADQYTEQDAPYRALAAAVVLRALEDAKLPIGPDKQDGVEFFVGESEERGDVRAFWSTALGWAPGKLKRLFLDKVGLPGDPKRAALFVGSVEGQGAELGTA